MPTDIDNLKPNPLKQDPRYQSKDTRPKGEIKQISGVAIALEKFKVELTDDELEYAKKILTTRLEVAELIKGNYSTPQLTEWAKTRGMWTAIGALVPIIVKLVGCI